MGSRLGVIIRSENGWKLYYDLGGVGARPPLARPSRSGHRLSRRAAPADVHPTGLFAFEGVVGGAYRILRRLPSGGP